MICYVILTLDVVGAAVLCKAPTPPVRTVLLKCDPSGVRGDSGGALTGMRPRGFEDAALCSTFNHCGHSVAGKFREKASILHKIAKKKCQVEDSEKANGVASRSGKKLSDAPEMWYFG